MTVDPVPLESLAGSLRSGEREATGFAAACCDRIDEVDPEVRAMLPEDGRRRRLEAAASYLEARYPEPADRPPLYGIPVGVKDIFTVEGFPTRAGSDLPAGSFTGPEAAVVRALRQAGAVVLGKTVSTEFAYADPGPTRNPHDTAHTPGGSSSGSAAAVAAGLCPLALGSQTIGSMLRPAAFCRVVGFKPSYGRVPLDGVVPFAPSVDHPGMFTPEVAGLRRVAPVVCDDWTAADPDDPPTLGVPEGPYLDRTSDAGREAFEEALDALAAAGYEIERRSVMDDFDAVDERHRRLAAAEFALTHHDRLEAHRDRLAESTVDLIEQGRSVGVGELGRARAGRHDLREALTAPMGADGIDLWVSPPALGPAPEGIDDTGDPVMNLPWTHAGMPAVSVPAGEVDGLPVGLQVAAAYRDDERLLAWAEPLADALAG